MNIENIVDTTIQSQVTGDTTAPEVEATAPEAETIEVVQEAPAAEQPKNDPEKLAKALDRKNQKLGQKTAIIHEMRRREQELLRELEQYRSSTSPKEEDSDDVQKFVDTRAEAKARAIIQEELSRVQQQSAAQQRAEHFVKRVESFTDVMPDIMEVLEENRDADLPEYLVDAISQIPEGPAVAALAFKQDLMDEIAALPPALALMEIGKLRDVVKGLGKPAAPVTKAPAPLVAAKGTGGGSKSLESMSGKDLMKWLRS
jgi:hypothetical protein